MWFKEELANLHTSPSIVRAGHEMLVPKGYQYECEMDETGSWPCPVTGDVEPSGSETTVFAWS